MSPLDDRRESQFPAVTVRPSGPSVRYVEALAEVASSLADDAQAPGTRTAYASAWRTYTAWCGRLGQPPAPASEALLVAYVAHLERRGVAHSTAVRHLSAIRWHHEAAGHPAPDGARLREVMRGHARRHGRAARSQATGLRTAHLVRIVFALDPTRPKDVRDRAIILVGFVSGCRRSELAALDLADLAEHDEGLRMLVRRGKADQEGRGSWRAVPRGRRQETCPVTALTAWTDLAGHELGPVFRRVRKGGEILAAGMSGRAIADVVRDRAAVVGLDGRWTAHSMRRGFATEAAARGVPRAQIMTDGGWSSSAVDEYIEAGSTFAERAGSHLGL